MSRIIIIATSALLNIALSVLSVSLVGQGIKILFSILGFEVDSGVNGVAILLILATFIPSILIGVYAAYLIMSKFLIRYPAFSMFKLADFMISLPVAFLSYLLIASLLV